jgi:hypothetical protein
MLPLFGPSALQLFSSSALQLFSSSALRAELFTAPILARDVRLLMLAAEAEAVHWTAYTFLGREADVE